MWTLQNSERSFVRNCVRHLPGEMFLTRGVGTMRRVVGLEGVAGEHLGRAGGRADGGAPVLQGARARGARGALH